MIDCSAILAKGLANAKNGVELLSACLQSDATLRAADATASATMRAAAEGASATLKSGDATAAASRQGAEATIQAATTVAHTTIFAALLALVAGYLAYRGARAVLTNGGFERKAAKDRDQQNIKNNLERMARVYKAELEGMWNFFSENDLIETLRSHSKIGQQLYFHPGESWLRTYTSDPTTIGVFENVLAGKIAYCYSRSLNELGRLRWLHEGSLTDPVARSKEQMNSANTLEILNQEANDIISDLKTIT